MPTQGDWHRWPDWMGKDVQQLLLVCRAIRLHGLLALSVMLEDDLTPPGARERFGLSLAE